MCGTFVYVYSFLTDMCLQWVSHSIYCVGYHIAVLVEGLVRSDSVTEKANRGDPHSLSFTMCGHVVFENC